MKKYKVTLHLMVNPTVGDETFKKTYVVEAKNESDAYSKALEQQSLDDESIRYRSVFNYNTKEI